MAEEFPGELARIIGTGIYTYIYIYNGNKCSCLNANHQRNTKKNTVSTHESSLGRAKSLGTHIFPFLLRLSGTHGTRQNSVDRELYVLSQEKFQRYGDMAPPEGEGS